MPKQHLFLANLQWTGSVRGPVCDYRTYSREYEVAFEGKPSLRGSADPTFLGDPALHNPEDLLVASLSACHMLSYLAICAREGLEVRAYSDRAVGTMLFGGGSGRFTDVTLHPQVELAAGVDLDAARAAHEEAHKVCFIANSVNFPVRHEALVNHASD